MYVRIARGRRSKGDLPNEAIEAVKKTFGENGWFAVDRGMDSVEFIFFMKRRDFLGVVRVNKMDRDVFGTGRPRKPPEREPDQLEFAFPDAA